MTEIGEHHKVVTMSQRKVRKHPLENRNSLERSTDQRKKIKMCREGEEEDAAVSEE